MTEENKNENQPTQETSTMGSIWQFVWDLVKILIIALVIIVPFRMFVAEPFVVSGSSMQPNFHNHDYLIIDRLSYIKGSPARGDVIVLKFPKDTSQFFIKRVIGLPGETVKIQQGKVYIMNSEHEQPWALAESYIPKGVETIAAPQEVRLGSSEYFVLGDNRTASSDSRVWGILPENDIVGKVWARVYPPSAAGFFQTPSY